MFSLFSSPFHLKSIKIFMRNLFSFIICHSCNLTNLRGTAVALLSFLTYAISTITVVGLKENQTNQHSEGAFLATELHILTEIETKVMIKNEIFICQYLCLWQLHPNFLHLSPKASSKRYPNFDWKMSSLNERTPLHRRYFHFVEIFKAVP